MFTKNELFDLEYAVANLIQDKKDYWGFHAQPREIFLPPSKGILKTQRSRRDVSRMVFESLVPLCCRWCRINSQFSCSQTIVFEARKYESKISRGWAWNPYCATEDGNDQAIHKLKELQAKVQGTLRTVK